MRLTAIVMTGGVLAALATAPAVADDLHRDRRDIRQDRREIREDHRDIRHDRRELHCDRRELQRDRAGRSRMAISVVGESFPPCDVAPPRRSQGATRRLGSGHF